MVDRDGGKTIEAVKKTLRIIMALSRGGTLGTTELARQLDISKSTAHHHLNTLAQDGFVINEDGTYRLSLRFLEFGELVRERSIIYRVGKPEVTSLSEDTDQLSNLLTVEQGMGVFLLTESGQRRYPSDFRVGERVHLDTLASGKAILANLSDERIAEIITMHDIPASTSENDGAAEELLGELERIRSQGYAVEQNDRSDDRWSIGAPILKEGTVLGAVGLTCFSDDFSLETHEEQLAEQVTKTAEVISIKLDYS